MVLMTASEVPRQRGMLDVCGGQHIYWEEWGSPDGVPAVYLHGGPGAGLRTSEYRHRFDLTRTRLVGFEQRGCGRSTPHACDTETSLAANTTEHLVEDIERLRAHLGIERWIVNGASWGSTLALAYAQAHPKRVRGLVLFAVTTTSRQEVDWITEGVGSAFPEAWNRFAGHAENAGIGYRRGRVRLIEAYAQLTESADPVVREALRRSGRYGRTRTSPPTASYVEILGGTTNGSGWHSCGWPRTTGRTTASATQPCSSESTGFTGSPPY